MTDCPDFDALLEHVLGEGKTLPFVADHVRSCAACTQEVLFLRDVCGALEGGTAISDESAERIVEAVAANAPPRPGAWSVLLSALPTSGLAALAVALALPVLAPGGARSVYGTVLYALLVGCLVAVWEVVSLRRAEGTFALR